MSIPLSTCHGITLKFSRMLCQMHYRAISPVYNSLIAMRFWPPMFRCNFFLMIALGQELAQQQERQFKR